MSGTIVPLISGLRFEEVKIFHLLKKVDSISLKKKFYFLRINELRTDYKAWKWLLW